MRWKMPNVAIVAVATAAVLFLVTADTVLDGAGDGGGSNRFGGGGGGGGGERQRGAATAAANRHRDNMDSDDEATQQTPATVQCGASCTNHEEIKTLSIELIKASILNKLGMRQPPEFGDRLPLKVPTDLPPLQDLMRKYNNERSGSVVVLPHMRHQSHHNDATGDGGGYDMQSDEASPTGYAATMTASNSKNGRDDDGDGGGNENDDDDDDDDEDDYHVRTHKLIAFAQPHPTIQKLRGHSLLFFTFSEQTGQHKITQAILWVYRKRLDVVIDDSVVVIEVNRINQITMHQTLLTTIKHVINTTEPGWVPINLQKHMFKTTDRAKNLTLMVHSYYHTKNASHAKTPYVTDTRKNDMTKIPYLEVHTEYSRRSRTKRNALGINCDETSTETRCCRYPLTVDFDEFGWDWIIAPRKYTANYCSGECPLVFLQKYPHTYLTQLANQTTRAYSGTGPCCVPRKLSAISMLYFDQDLNIIYGLLPGMVADRCGCS